jgi:glutaminyl-tRNA synthetase
LQLFKSENPADTEDWLADFDKESEEVLHDALVVSGLEASEPFSRFQLERLGYFCVDPDSKPGSLVLNRTCTLRDQLLRKIRPGQA